MNWRPDREETRQQTQEELDLRKTRLERNRLGQFATPFSLALQIMTVAQDYQGLATGNTRFLEPALSSGAFYSALLAVKQGKPPAAAVGYEVDSQTVEAARRLWGESGLTVCNDDFTAAAPPEQEADRFNLIVTNPPYVRHHHLERPEKARLQALVMRQLGVRPSGLMGLYGYFLLLAQAWMQPDGLGVWLIPTEFMDVGYGAVLKRYLTSQVQLLRVHRFDADDVQFDDADITSTVLFLRNRRPSADHQVAFSVGASLKEPRKNISVSLRQLREQPKWTAVGDKYHAYPADRPVTGNGRSVPLGVLFNVKRGLVTGANRYFIMTKAEAEEREIPEQFLQPVLPSPRHLQGQEIIEADKAELPLVKPRLFLLNCSLPKEQIADPYPSLYRYILQGEAEGLPERYLLSRRNPWYRQEEREAAPILCGYMGRKKKNGAGHAIRFYRNHSQAIAANVYLMLYPRPALQNYLYLDDFLDVVFERLLTLDLQQVLYHGRSYGGGLDKIEPNELQRITLATRNELLEIVASLQEPETVDEIQVPWEPIDELLQPQLPLPF